MWALELSLSRVRLLVCLQVACICCFIFTLIALVQFFPGVLLDMSFEVGSPVARKVALCAIVRLLFGVYDQVGLQITILAK